jgi:hypothetical protein
MRRPTVHVPVASGNDWGNNGFGFFFHQLELSTWQYASARRPILSTDATALVVRRATPARSQSSRGKQMAGQANSTFKTNSNCSQ